jgi:hypothetical protein
MTIATPVGLVVTSSSIPNYVPRGTGTPTEWHSLGRINLGNALGYFERIRIQLSPQVIYPIPDEMTLLSTNQAAGVTYGIDEIVSSASLPTRLEPWDRTPTQVSSQSTAQYAGGTGQTQTWTYTVPTGKKLWLARAAAHVARDTAATTVGMAGALIFADGRNLCQAVLRSNVLGAQDRDELNGGPFILSAGQAIAGYATVSDTGGLVTITLTMAGFTFDA